MQAGASHDVALQRVDQRAEQRRTLPNPVGQGGALELDARTPVDLRLAVERQVVAELDHQHVRQQAGSRAAAADR